MLQTGKSVKRLAWLLAIAILGLPLCSATHGQQALTAKQLKNLLKRFPAADTDGDGELTVKEATTYRNKVVAQRKEETRKRSGKSGGKGIVRDFNVHPGWEMGKFPEDALCYKSPNEIKVAYQRVTSGKQPAVVSYTKPTDGGLRVVGVGHSFMAPGYRTLPLISKAAGMTQPLYTYVGGGMTGSARYKWEQENGIFQFAGKPVPKLLSSIANAEWDAMMFGPYFNDRAEYYACWIDFCLKYNPDMKFYLSDAWPQLEQLSQKPDSEAFFTDAVLDRLGNEKRANTARTLQPLLRAYPGKVFVLPTSDAMVLAAKRLIRGELPGIEGFHRAIGGKERSLWKDQLGHLGPGLDRLEGYVFYAKLYGKTPEKIDGSIPLTGDGIFPSPELDCIFRKIAWQAVAEHPYAGVSKQ